MVEWLKIVLHSQCHIHLFHVLANIRPYHFVQAPRSAMAHFRKARSAGMIRTYISKMLSVKEATEKCSEQHVYVRAHT